MDTEKTGTYVQHADDLGRDISNAILKWERRNPGKKVIELHARHNCDVLAPHLYVTTEIGFKAYIDYDPLGEGNEETDTDIDTAD